MDANGILMHEITPLRIGHVVKVNDSCEFYEDWKDDVYIVVGMEWKYKNGGDSLSIWIATEDEIKRGHGCTDGFRPDELTFVGKQI